MFRATHEITTTKNRVLVMLDANESGAGPAYTREEWDNETSADFEFDGERWTFQGDAGKIESVVRIDEWFREPSGGIDVHARSAWHEREDESYYRKHDDMPLPPIAPPPMTPRPAAPPPAQRPAPRMPTRQELLASVVPPPIPPRRQYQFKVEDKKPEAPIEWWYPADDPRSGR